MIIDKQKGNTMELNNEIYIIVKECSRLGEMFFEVGEYRFAIEKYKEALEILPHSKNQWEAATWLNTALGDSYFMVDSYEEAKNYFFDALNCPNGTENPFILLRLGQSLWELDEKRKALEYLIKAYKLGGKRIFDGEDEKYFRFFIKWSC